MDNRTVLVTGGRRLDHLCALLDKAGVAFVIAGEVAPAIEFREFRAIDVAALGAGHEFKLESLSEEINPASGINKKSKRRRPRNRQRDRRSGGAG